MHSNRFPTVCHCRPDFRTHALEDDWANRREFHLAGDDLVVYIRKERALEIVMLRVGTHRQLFRRRLKRKKRKRTERAD